MENKPRGGNTNGVIGGAAREHRARKYAAFGPHLSRISGVFQQNLFSSFDLIFLDALDRNRV